MTVSMQCDFCFDLFLVLVFQLFFGFSFVLVFIIFLVLVWPVNINKQGISNLLTNTY